MTFLGDPSIVSAETKQNINSQDENVFLRGLMLSDEAREVLEIIFNVVLNGFVSLLGSAVNVVNIIVFVKQGFIDSLNISLCALAVSDIGCLVPLVWLSLCSNPLFQQSDIGFTSIDMEYLAGGLPHSCFIRITCLITAFITFERCLCIALPLKVKTIITPRRTLISIVTIFLLMFATCLPLVSTIYLSPSFLAKTNTTSLWPINTEDIQFIQYFSLSLVGSVQFLSFIIITICTVILVLKLFTKLQFRQKAVFMSDISNAMSSRDKRVMKMVTFISTIFIICYLPRVINLLLVVPLFPEYSATGKYENSYLVSWTIINAIEGTNSSVTIFVYYNMSSKFRVTFHELFSTTNKVSMNFMTIVKRNDILKRTT